MYTIKRHLMSLVVIGSLAISAFFMTSVDAKNISSQSEIAAISVRFGGGGFYGHRGPYYRHRWGYGPYWRYGHRPYWRHHGFYRPYYRHYYYNPHYYYYGRPGGAYFYWRR